MDAEHDSDVIQRTSGPTTIDKQDELRELGLRIGEIIALEIEDFDLKRGVVQRG
jgi:integrase